MLLTMSSMDRSVLVQVNFFRKDVAAMHSKGAGRIPQRIQMLVEILEKPQEVLEKQNRIKDLLFPDDALPPGINRQDLKDNLQILQRPEGVALVLSDRLLFNEGSGELSPLGRPLLEQVAQVLSWMDADVNIAGYADNQEAVQKPSDSGPPELDAYQLSGRRALTVLDYFVRTGYLEQSRFSITGYGPQWPIADNNTAEGREKNRRVEILVKTTPHFAGYRP